MSAFLVALRESVHDPEKMKLYAEKSAGSANGHRVTSRAAYGRLRMTEGEPIEGASSWNSLLGIARNFSLTAS